jgi:hypothetical protein
MGCGCGGRRGAKRAAAVTPRPAGDLSARRVQTQSTQRQVLAQQARDRIQQNSGGQQRNAVGAKDDIERRRRIQVSLRNRNKG